MAATFGRQRQPQLDRRCRRRRASEAQVSDPQPNSAGGKFSEVAGRPEESHFALVVPPPRQISARIGEARTGTRARAEKIMQRF